MIHYSDIGLAFLEGLSLFVSPCILPVLPIVLSASVEGERSRPFGIIIGFIVCFTTFTLFSRQLVASLGLDPSVIRQVSFFILVAFGLILLSTRLSDAFARWTQGLTNLGNQFNKGVSSKNGFLSGLLVGCCIGLIWVPCSGPILAAVIVESIQQETSFAGTLVVLSFAVGAGLPMLLFAWGGNRLMGNLGFFKRHSEWLRKAMGVIIILTVIVTAQDSFLPLLGQGKTGNTTGQSAMHLEKGLPKAYPAPEIAGIQTWINSKPLRLSELKGKVVLIDFWTYSCINCIRTLPSIKAWDAKYRKQGLVIIGVHSPEFEFEKNANNVQSAVAKQGIHYPVALDNQFKTWKNFDNHYWPAHYLIDKKGNVVYTHFGEGEDDITENNIRYLLGVHGTVAKNASENAGSGFDSLQTPETYLGSDRAESFASTQGLKTNQTVQYTYPSFLGINHWALKGPWHIQAQNITAEKAGAALQFNFYAKQVFLVLGTRSGHPVSAKILLNGNPIGKQAGQSVHNSVLTVTQHTLYTLVQQGKAKNGLLEIQTQAPGLEAYAFTFGS